MENKNEKSVAIFTLGCKVNQYETNAMIQKFKENNFKIVNFNDVSDIYVINTCTVTNIAEKKSRQMIRKAKEQNKNAIIIAVGCYAQVAEKELEKLKEIDLILGTNEKNKIVEYVNEYIEERKNINKTSDVLAQKEFLDFGDVLYTEKTRAVIKIQDGCDRYCSYCIIPFARGRVRSRLPENIVNEVIKIAKNDIKEIVITGIHIASYGKDFKEKFTLIDLLEKLNEIQGIKRIRLGSIEPTIITEDFVNRIVKLKKVCNHFHLSLQSGCDATLKRMNRKYTTQEFEKSVNLLRNAYKDVCLTTDIIVGFPGETEEEFNKTYDFLKKIKFYKMHIFKYSQRKGTKAAIMPNQINPQIKEQRSKKLIELSDKYEKEILNTYIGKTVKVLFETGNKGYTSNYICVKSKTNGIANELINVKIDGLEGLQLTGQIM